MAEEGESDEDDSGDNDEDDSEDDDDDDDDDEDMSDGEMQASESKGFILEVDEGSIYLLFIFILHRYWDSQTTIDNFKDSAFSAILCAWTPL